MLAVGTKVIYGGQTATITQVDVSDPELPYLVRRGNGINYWVRYDEVSEISTVYQVTEEDINAVTVKDHIYGDYATSIYKISSSVRTPESLRDTAAQHITTATHYEALARHMESQVYPDEDAKAIYYEAFPEERGYLSWDAAPPESRVMARNLAEVRK